MKLELVQISTGNQLREDGKPNSFNFFPCPESIVERTFVLPISKISLEKPTPKALVFPPAGRQCLGCGAERAETSFLKHKIAPFTVQLHFSYLLPYHVLFSNRLRTSRRNQQDNRMYKIPYNAFPFVQHLLPPLLVHIYFVYLHYTLYF